jgi:hypothetical protein
MASNASIVIQDGESSPVTRTFAPDNIESGVATYKDRSSGIPVGYGTLTVSRPKTPQDLVNGSYKAVVQLTLPKLETISGSEESGFTPAPRVAYNCIARVEVWLPVRSTTQDRENLRVLLIDALADAIIVDVIEDLEFVW